MAGTASGAKTVLYNTRERLVSTDHNREQAFGAQALAEALRWLLDPAVEQDQSGSGYETMGSGSETPLRATVLSGVRFRPDIGTANAFIDPGAVLLVDNAAPGSDDSVASFVSDPGIQTNGALVLTPGAGSTRIDVVECQRVTNVLETDNRDVFSPATGLFTPTNVTKVQAGQLTYRIRTGTPGSGFPGSVQGWLPLAVCSVPASATTWDAVTVWDVRPLASDRTGGTFAQARMVPWGRRHLAFCDATTASSPRIFAEVDLDFGGYRAGGLIRKNSSTIYIDPSDTVHQAVGFSFGTSGALWHAYLMFPFGLPRWVRYTDYTAGGPRKPGTQRGIVTISSQVAGYNGTPYAPISTPPGYGLMDSASHLGVLAFCGRGPKSGSNPIGAHCDGQLWTYVNADTYVVSPTTTTTALMRWTLDTTLVPGNARALHVRFFAQFQFPAPASGAEGSGLIDALVTVSDGTPTLASVGFVGATEGESLTEVDSNPTTGTPGVNFTRQFSVRIPFQPYAWPIPQAAPRTFVVTWTHNAGGSITISNAGLTVLGWELGP
jgi:hypothetical protein